MKRVLVLYIDEDICNCLYLKGREVEEVVFHLSSPETKFLSKVRTSRAKVVLLFPRKKSFFRSFSMPALKGKDLKEAMCHELSRVLPYPLDDMIFDWRHKKTPNGLEVRAIAARNSDVQEAVETLYDLDLKVDEILSMDEALLAGFKSIGNVESPLIIAGLHGSVLSVTLVDGYGIMAGREVEITDNDKIKEELCETLRYYSTLVKGSSDSIGVYLLGTLHNLNLWMEEETGLTASKIDEPSDVLPLALFGGGLLMQRKLTALSLAPWNHKKGKKKVGAWVLSVLLLALLFTTHTVFMLKAERIDHLEREVIELEERAREVVVLKNEYADIQDILNQRRAFLSNDTSYARILVRLNETLPQGTLVESMYLEEGELKEIRGRTPSMAELLNAIEGSGSFSEPRLLSPISKGRDGLEEFRLSLRFIGGDYLYED